MAGEPQKLSQLPDVTFPLTGGEYLYIVQNGEAKRVTSDKVIIISGVVDTYNDLPDPVTYANHIYFVKNTTGIIFTPNRHVAGFYIPNGATWVIISPVNIDGYQVLISSPTADKVVTVDANGQVQQSSQLITDLISSISSNQIHALTEKTSIVDADTVLSENSQSSWVKISVAFSTIFNYIKNKFSARKQYYVSSSGNDSNNGLTPETAVLTLGQALTLSDNSGNQIVILPGTYPENVTATDLNVTVTAANSETGGIVNFTGTITISNPSSSIRLQGLTIATLVKTNSGSLYLDRCTVGSGGFSDSGSGYVRITQSDLTAGSVTLTGAGYKNFENGCAIGPLTINNAFAVVTVNNAQKVQPLGAGSTVLLTTGVLIISGSKIVTFSNAYSGIVGVDGTLIVDSSSVLNTDGSPGTINLSAGITYSRSNFKYSSSSVINATTYPIVSNFDSVKTEVLNLSGQTASRLVLIDASKNLISADTATYPTPTELSYIKGLTRALTVFGGDSGSGGYVGLVPAPTAGQGTADGSGVSPYVLRASGGFAKPVYVPLELSLTNAITLTSTGAWGNVQLDTKDYDPSNIHSTSTYQTTINKTGTWLIRLSVTFSEARNPYAIGISRGTGDPVESTKTWHAAQYNSGYTTLTTIYKSRFTAGDVVSYKLYVSSLTFSSQIVTAGTRIELEFLRGE